MSFWEVIASQDSSLSEVTRVIGRMLNDHQIVFDQKSRKFSLQGSFKKPSEKDGVCQACQGKGLVLEGRFKQALAHFLKLTKERPPPVLEYNQGIIDPQDLARKATFMDRRGDLEGRSILLLGDDDLFSLLLALLGFGCAITVLEVDDRLIRFINKKAAHHGLSVTARLYDVKSPLPNDLQSAYDTFVTEPPEGLRGMLLFLERAIGALGRRGSGYLGLTTLESSLPKWLAIQKFLVARGVVVTDVLRHFSLYPEAGDPIKDYRDFPLSREFSLNPGPPDVDYFRSSLIRIEKTDEITTTGDQGFYTDEDTWVTVNPEDREAV